MKNRSNSSLLPFLRTEALSGLSAYKQLSRFAMKRYLLTLLLVLPVLLSAQNDPAFCGKMLDKAKAALAVSDWNKARDYCETALPVCPALGDELSSVLKAAADSIAEQTNRAKRAEAGADAQRRNAEAARNKAIQARQRAFESYIKNADASILKMNYELALKNLNGANALQLSQDGLYLRYFEIAYWFNEINRTDRATGILDTALVMKGESKISMKLGANPSCQQLRDILQNLDSDNYNFLQRRYYPYMIPIKGGTFQMGCDPLSLEQAGIKHKNDGGEYETLTCPENERLHSVSLDDYYLAESETTWWQFGLYRAANGEDVWKGKSNWPTTGEHPVVNVSWFDAIQYANWLSRQLEKDSVYSGDLRGKDRGPEADWTKRGYRLPTEAEWEYAARAGTDEIFAGTSSPDSLYVYTNYDDDGKKDGFEHTAPVKTYRPNHWGLYDMSGNVGEWCWDWYEEDFYKDGQKNPIGPSESGVRVFRGGSGGGDPVSLGSSLGGDPASLRCANRESWFPWDNLKSYGLGFRLAKAAH